MVKGIHMDSSAKKKNAKLTWRDVGITIGTLGGNNACVLRVEAVCRGREI